MAYSWDMTDVVHLHAGHLDYLQARLKCAALKDVQMVLFGVLSTYLLACLEIAAFADMDSAF